MKPAKKKSKKKKTPSALRRSAKRRKRFQEKKAAEQATLPKSPANEVVSAVRKEQETITVFSKDSCKDLESSDRSPIERLTCVKQGLKHLENQASENLSLAEEQAILLEVLEKAGIDSDDDLEDAGECANCHRQPEKGLEIKKCTRCRITRYCSKKCQTRLVVSSLRMRFGCKTDSNHHILTVDGISENFCTKHINRLTSS